MQNIFKPTKTNSNMAKPIIDNPALYGRDAVRFREMANDVSPVSDAYMQQFSQDVAYLRVHADFSL